MTAPLTPDSKIDFAQNGNGLAGFGSPMNVAMMKQDLCVALQGTGVEPNESQVLDLSSPTATVICGGGTSLENGIPCGEAKIAPMGLKFDSSGNLYILDNRPQDPSTGTTVVVRVVNKQETTQTLFGKSVDPTDIFTISPAFAPGAMYPFLAQAMAFDSNGNLVIAELRSAAVWRMSSTDGSMVKICDNPPNEACDMAIDSQGNIWVTDLSCGLWIYQNNQWIKCTSGQNPGPATPIVGTGIAVTSDTMYVYFTCVTTGQVLVYENFSNCLTKVVANSNGVRGTVSLGQGTAGSATLDMPCGLWLDSSDNLYIADASGSVLKISPTT